MLEFGCGPVPIYQCSSPLHASEIVFAEYTERNRNTLQMWLVGKEKLGHWSKELNVKEVVGGGLRKRRR